MNVFLLRFLLHIDIDPNVTCRRFLCCTHPVPLLQVQRTPCPGCSVCEPDRRRDGGKKNVARRSREKDRENEEQKGRSYPSSSSVSSLLVGADFLPNRLRRHSVEKHSSILVCLCSVSSLPTHGPETRPTGGTKRSGDEAKMQKDEEGMGRGAKQRTNSRIRNPA